MWGTKDATDQLVSLPLITFPFSLGLSGLGDRGTEFANLFHSHVRGIVKGEKGECLWSDTYFYLKTVMKLLVFCYNPFFSYSESKSPLCGTEENTFPLNNGLKTNLIYK